jgi:hypothetical protein
MSYQFTQGALVTITTTTTDQFGNPVAPDGLVPPTVSVDFQTPDGPINVLSGAIMVPISNSFYYFNIDSTALAVGSYSVSTTTYIAGIQMIYPQRFDIVAGNGFTLLPLDPISRVRLRLKDMDPDPSKWVWSDMELSEYLQGSLDEFNSAPPRSNYFWMNVPIQYMTCIMKGAQIAALEAEATRVAQQPITFNDKGITVNLPQQSSTLQNIARMLREQQEKERLRIKRQLYPKAGFIVTPQMPSISHAPIRASNRIWW